MATLVELDQQGHLFKFDPELDVDELEVRCLYAAPNFVQWVQDVLPVLGSTWQIEQAPKRQFYSFMAIYASGEIMTFGWQFHPVKSITQGVWVLKTADLRIFGWFPQKDYFIAVVGNTKQHTQDHGLVPGYRETVVRFRENIDLDEPKFVSGDDPNAVISNYTLA